MSVEDTITLIKSHIEKYPQMEVTDIYKLLYQGVFGVGHLITEKAWDRLKSEAEGLDLNVRPKEPLKERVSPDGKMIRVNLRPYLRKSLSLKDLYEAMIETAKYEGEFEEFLKYWQTFKKLVESADLSLDKEKISRFDKQLEIKKKATPRHHSMKYRDTYHPAYRVVRLATLRALC
jgi:hypothetical protein